MLEPSIKRLMLLLHLLVQRRGDGGRPIYALWLFLYSVLAFALAGESGEPFAERFATAITCTRCPCSVDLSHRARLGGHYRSDCDLLWFPTSHGPLHVGKATRLVLFSALSFSLSSWPSLPDWCELDFHLELDQDAVTRSVERIA